MDQLYRCTSLSKLLLTISNLQTKFLSMSMMLLVSGLLYGQPSNDLCQNAIMLPVDGSCQVYNNTDATPSNNPNPLMLCDQNSNIAEDVWFKVTAPASGNFTIELTSVSGGPDDMIMELHEGSCGNLSPIECSHYKVNNDFEMPLIEREGMSPGMDYYIRLSSQNNADFGQFIICVSDQGYNQFPYKVTLIEPSGQSVCDPLTNTYTQELTIHYRDVLGEAEYLFLLDQQYPIAPSPMIITIPNVPANSGWQTVFPQLEPFFSESGLFVYNGFQRRTNCYSGTVANDECTGAFVISPDNMCVAYTGNNLGATHSGTGGYCEPFSQGAQDVWFKHTTTSTEDIIINAWDGTEVSPSVLVYKGSCGQLNYEDCAFSYRSVRLTGLSIGETIYIQVKDTNDDNQSDFNLCLIYSVPTTNDICSNAIVIPTTPNCDLSQVYSNHFSTDENNGSQPPACATYLAGSDLWYQFEVTADGFLSVRLDLVINGDYPYNANVAEVYAGTCGSLQFLQCAFLDIQNSLDIVNRTPGEILYVRIIQDSFKPYVICTAELSNNLCLGAEEIPVGTCITTDNFGATPSDNPHPGLLCGNSGIGNDVWYSTIVPASGNLTVETNEIQNGLTSINLEVYDGSGCNALNPIACSDSKDQSTNYSRHAKIELEGRMPGETIYIRVIENFGNSEGSFEICVSDAGYNDPCNIELIQLVGQSNCDPVTNTFTQDLLVSYRHDGNATAIEILGMTYTLTSSPQLISIELPASGAIISVYANLIDNFNFNDCYQTSAYNARDVIQLLSPCFNGTVSNDECIDAIPLAVSNGCIEAVFNNTGSSQSSNIGYTCYTGNQSQVIWFSAEVPSSGDLIINSWNTSQVESAFDVYEGDCNNLTLIENCGIFDRSLRLSGRQAGEIIYIVAYSIDVFQQGEFGLCAIEPEPHNNDICLDAIDVPISSECSQLVYSTHLAIAENGSIDCNGTGSNSNDIWFKVVVPNGGNLTLKTEEVERGSSNIIMEVYAGGCQSPFTTCAQSNSSDGHAEINLTGIFAGSELHVRIASFYNYISATFTFCAISDCPDTEFISFPIQDVKDYEADISVSGNSLIQNTATVDFDAGQEVNLIPGFEVQSGAVFHAFIDGCGGSQ